MTAVHRSESDIGWLKRRINELARDAERDRAARKLEAATIGAGGLHVRGGDVFLEDADGNIIWQASTDPVKTVGAYDDDDGLNLPTSWTRFGDTASLTVQIPKSYRSGHLQMFVAAGDTFDSSGNVSVEPVATFTRQSGATGGGVGPAINSGNGSVSVANSFWAANFNLEDQIDTDPWVSMTFGVNIAESANANTTFGNWHVAASVIFKRGA